MTNANETIPFEDALDVLRSANYKYGPVDSTTIAPSVRDPEWQKFRLSMKGVRTITKINMLRDWYVSRGGSLKAWVQVTNYLNALKRGGQLK